MATLRQLEAEIKQVKERNKRVETDKAWEVSWTRKLTIVVITYFAVAIFLIVAKLPNPWVNALIPSLAFLLSSMTVPIVKLLWLEKTNK